MEEIEINGKAIPVAVSVDVLGLYCPLPLAELRLALDKMECGQVAELLADDPGILEDLPAWCSETGNRLLSIEEGREGIFVAYIEKRKVSPPG